MKKEYTICDKCGKHIDESRDSVCQIDAVVLLRGEMKELSLHEICEKCAERVINAIDSYSGRRMDIDEVREQDPVRAEKLEYFKKWRADNKDKVSAHNKKYWEQRAAKKLMSNENK